MSEERITYDEFMIMLKFAPKMCYTLYDKAEDEIDRLNNIINELEKDSIAFKKLNAWIVNRHAPDLFHKMEIIDKLEELKDSDKE